MNFSTEPLAPDFDMRALAAEPLRPTGQRLLERCIVWQLLRYAGLR